jgi:hypothetical protein
MIFVLVIYNVELNFALKICRLKKLNLDLEKHKASMIAMKHDNICFINIVSKMLHGHSGYKLKLEAQVSLYLSPDINKSS